MGGEVAALRKNNLICKNKISPSPRIYFGVHQKMVGILKQVQDDEVTGILEKVINL